SRGLLLSCILVGRPRGHDPQLRSVVEVDVTLQRVRLVLVPGIRCFGLSQDGLGRGAAASQARDRQKSGEYGYDDSCPAAKVLTPLRGFFSMFDMLEDVASLHGCQRIQPQCLRLPL